MEEKLEHNGHQEIMDKYWEESQKNPIIEGLNLGKSLDEILSSFPDFKKGFKVGSISNSVKCSDGRVNNTDGGEKLGVPGSGILSSDEEFNHFVEGHYGKIKEVTSHENCGAGAVKYAQMKAAGEPMPEGVNNSDELAQQFAKKAAKLLGAEYRHIPASEFTCQVHNERAVVIDGTARFDPNRLDYFPPTFLLSDLGLGYSSEYVAEETEILAGISLGDHGFDDKFSQENPFYLMVIAEDKDQMNSINQALKDFVEKQDGRVKMVGIIRPE